MSSVARILALALVAGALGGCLTSGWEGAPSNVYTAKPTAAEEKAVRRIASSNKPTKSATDTRSESKHSEVAGVTGSVNAGSDKSAANRTAEVPPEKEADGIPAKSMFGIWTLAENDGPRECRVILGSALLDSGYSARSDADCPDKFAAVRSWEVRGYEIVLRNQSRRVIGRLAPTGPARFDGQSESGTSVHLIR